MANYHFGLRQVSAKRFGKWLSANGAEVLPTKDYEFVRFRAHGVLCIVTDGRKGRAPQSELAREAVDAFLAKRTLNLRNDEIAAHSEPDWRTVGKAGCALAARVQAGEVIDLDAAAAEIGIRPDRMARIASAHALRLADGKITRAAA